MFALFSDRSGACVCLAQSAAVMPTFSCSEAARMVSALARLSWQPGDAWLAAFVGGARHRLQVGAKYCADVLVSLPSTVPMY
jgi:hypothetical protein